MKRLLVKLGLLNFFAGKKIMGKQLSGMPKLKGSFDPFNFYECVYGDIVRMKSNLTKERFKNDPCFAAARNHGDEFGRGSKAGSVVRNAFLPLVEGCGDHTTSGRLTALFTKVMQGDTTHEKGKRTIRDGKPELLVDFNFKDGCRLSQVLPAKVHTHYDESFYAASLVVEAFDPSLLKSPSSATHVCLKWGIAQLDFTEGIFVSHHEDSGYVSLKDAAAGFAFMHCFDDNAGEVMMWMAAVSFYQEVNGEFYVLKEKKYELAEVVGVRCN